MKLDLRQVCSVFTINITETNTIIDTCEIQESGRHSETLDAITKHFDMGTYSEWDEKKRIEFLTKELKGKRPLIPLCIEVRRLPN